MKLKETLAELKSMPIEVACCSLSMIVVVISMHIGIITTKISLIMICVVFVLYMMITLYRVYNGIMGIGKCIREMQKTFREINSVE